MVYVLMFIFEATERIPIKIYSGIWGANLILVISIGYNPLAQISYFVIECPRR
jgi:hypothetical protein